MDILPGQQPQVNTPSMAQHHPIVEEKFKKSNGETGIRRYLKGKFLGKGGFAKCYEFINADTKYVHAAKII